MSETQTAEELIAELPKNATESIRVRHTEYGGHKLVDCRVFTKPQDGSEGVATRKGLCLRPETWRELCAVLLAELREEAPVENAEEGTPDVDGEDPLGGDV